MCRWGMQDEVYAWTCMQIEVRDSPHGMSGSCTRYPSDAVVVAEAGRPARDAARGEQRAVLKEAKLVRLPQDRRRLGALPLALPAAAARAHRRTVPSRSTERSRRRSTATARCFTT